MFRDFNIAFARKHIKLRQVRPLNFQRQGVAYLLSKSARNIPHAAGNIELDVTPVVEYGERIIRELKSGPGKLTPEQLTRMALHKSLSAFYIKAISHVIYNVPCLNGFLEWTPLRNGGVFYEAEDINLGFTVHTKRGVMTPGMRNAHKKDIFTVANEMREMTRKARRTDMNDLYRRCARAYLGLAAKELDPSSLVIGFLYLKSLLWPEPIDPEIADVPVEQRLQPEEVVGFTSIVANIGSAVEGWQTVTVVPHPSVFMWGIGYTRVLPRYINGHLVPRHCMNMCVTFDHRALDGGDIFPFADHMRNYISNPEKIFMWKPGDPI